MTKKKPKNALNIELQNLKECVPQNPVAKFAHHVNKAGFFRDRTVYSRKGKHKNNESFLIRYLAIVNTKGFVVLLNHHIKPSALNQIPSQLNASTR
ncbi:MAG: hypothetical protein PHC99_11780 [Methylococcales bacterium]|nr:hypothetical protein [Methylococcales bacterium]